MERTFKTEIPESFKKIEGLESFIEKTLSEHQEFITNGFKEHLSPAQIKELNATQAADSKTKSEELNKKAIKILPENLIDASGKQLIALSGLDIDDDDDAIKEKFSKAIEENQNLTQTSYNDYFAKTLKEQVPEQSEEETNKQIESDIRMSNL